jgi:hypothetical protein
MVAQGQLRAANQVASLFEPDALMPIQYLDTIRRLVPIEPEKRLMWAVLEDTIECYQTHCCSRRLKEMQSFSDAERWILERDNRWLFSFNNVCDMLGFDADYLRAGLIIWKEKQLGRAAIKNDADRAESLPQRISRAAGRS